MLLGWQRRTLLLPKTLGGKKDSAPTQKDGLMGREGEGERKNVPLSITQRERERNRNRKVSSVAARNPRETDVKISSRDFP